MTQYRERHELGIELIPTDLTDPNNTMSREGELSVDSNDDKLKVHLNGDTKEVITDDQTQTLTNKSVDADTNTISNLEVDNLKSGVLNTDNTLTGATGTQLPSALATKTYIESVNTTITNHINDTTDAHDASAISVIPTGNLAASDAQSAFNELQSNVDALYVDTNALETALDNHVNDTSAHGVTGDVVGTTDVQNLTNKTITGASIQLPSRLDVKQDTESNLITYATTASDGQLVWATDTKEMYTVKDGLLAPIGGDGGSDTGLLYGGVLSVNGVDNSKFDLSAGEGYITDTSDPENIVRTRVSWGAFTSQTVTALATHDVSYILINTLGAIVQQTTFPTPEERRQMIFLGRLPHINRTNITFGISLAEFQRGAINQLYDLFDALGPFMISGGKISANGANLSLNRSAGVMFNRSFSLPTNPENPHEVSITGGSAITMRYGTQTTYNQTDVTVLDPTKYDNLGTATTVPANNNATIQRIYLFPTGTVRVYYGQTVYSTFANAVSGYATDNFVENPNSQGFAVHLADVIITKTCSSLQDTTCAKIMPVGKLGSSAGGGGGITTLQQAYNNSAEPEIVTDTTHGALSIKRGSAADTDIVFEVKDGSSVTNFSIKGDGDTSISGDLFSGTHIVTGDVAASGTVTGSNLSGTNTGDLLGGGDNDTPATVSTLVVPNKQLTLTGTNQYRVNTGNNNELDNPNFEHSTVTIGWTVTNATASADTSTPFEGKKSLSLALTGALSLTQSSTINAARKSGVQMVASIWVKSDDVSDLQLCSMKNGAEDKCTVAGGYVQGSGWRQLTVSFLGDSTSNGLKLKSTDTTGTVLVDQAFVGIGSPIVDFTPDMVYSAIVTTTSGAVSQENTEWITSCTAANPSVCTFKTGEFTVTPNCSVSVQFANSLIAISYSASATGISIETKSSTTGAAAANTPVVIQCQKQGADYKTSKAYVASSSDYGWTAYTPTVTGLGTVTGLSARHKRVGDTLFIEGYMTAGTPTATEARVSLPAGLTSSSIIGTLSLCGDAGKTQVSAGDFRLATLCESSVTYVTFGSQTSSTSAIVKANGNSLIAASSGFKFNAKIPISGWENSSVIVGSFQGYNETPGTSRVETFSFSYGTTNATTACTASPCSYLDQIGNNVTSVTRGGNGNYTANLSKTYTKVKCSLSATIPGTGAAIFDDIQSYNSSTISISTRNPAQTSTDTRGVVYCQGIPQ